MYKKLTIKFCGYALSNLQLKQILMRLTVIWLVVGMHLSAYAIAQKVTLNRKDIQLTTVFKEIKQQTGYNFLYDVDAVREAPRLSLDIRSVDIKEALDECFRELPLKYVIQGNNIIISKKSKSTDNLVEATQQQRIIKGTVRDEYETLAGVTVKVEGENLQTQTDDQGHFILNIDKDIKALLFSYVGYKNHRHVLTNENEVNITLENEVTSLDELVVIGYGTSSKRTLTTAISKLDGKALESRPINTVGDGMKGKVAGVRVYTADNQPGAGPVFRIRGGSSINKSNSPLILVDGVERDIVGLNPNDIESISALKDAASTAIYGAKASNGVIMVTTKKGVSKAPTISFESSFAHQNKVQNWNTLGAEDYIRVTREAVAVARYPERNFLNGYSASSGNVENSIFSTRYLQDGESIPEGYKSMLDPLDPSKTLIFQDNNFMDRYFRPTTWQNYYLSTIGGNERVKYNFSAGYKDDKGVGIATGYQSFTVHGNTEFKINDNFTFEGGYDFAENTTEDLPSNKNTYLMRTLSIPNTQKVFWPETGIPVHSINKSTVAPDWLAYYHSRKRSQKYSTVIGTLTWKPIDDLRIVARGTNSDRYSRYNGFVKETNYKDPRSANSTFTSTTRRNIQAYANYNKSFSEIHALDLMAGSEYQTTINDGLSATAEGGASDLIPTLTAQPIPTAANSGSTNFALMSYFGRANYSLKNRYLLSASLRADGSSLFSKENRWGYFPAVSAAWIISEEDYMKDVSFIENMKLRSSFGQTGNNNIGFFDATGSYSVSGKYDGGAAMYASVMGNKDLKWETTTQFDVGLEVGMLKNRISFTVDYYNKVTKDLIFGLTLPNSTGFSSVNVNSGSVRFYGVDLELNTRNVETKNFTWSTDFTYSYNMNKILKLPNNGLPQNRMNGQAVGGGSWIGGYAEGERIGSIWGFVQKGIIETQEQADNAYYDSRALGFRFSDGLSIPGRKEIGDYEWINREGSSLRPDGSIQIDNEDQFLLGYSLPHTIGGLGNTFKYKNLSLYVFLDYQVGAKMFNYLYAKFLNGTFTYSYNLHEDVLKTWTKPGDDTKLARYFANDSDDGNRNFASRTNTIMTQKSDYLCIREISLSYDLPERWIQSAKIKNLKAYLSANNLFYFTELVGLNPENPTSVGNNTSDYSIYPSVRSFSAGIKVTF